MIFRCLLVFMVAGAAQAQSTKWDMPTPYSEGEFHTRNVKQFVEDVQKATGGKLEIVVDSQAEFVSWLAGLEAEIRKLTA